MHGARMGHASRLGQKSAIANIQPNLIIQGQPKSTPDQLQITKLIQHKDIEIVRGTAFKNNILIIPKISFLLVGKLLHLFIYNNLQYNHLQTDGSYPLSLIIYFTITLICLVHFIINGSLI